MRDGADVVLVAVREDERRDPAAIGVERADIGNDQVDAEELRPGKHHAGVDEQSGIPAGDEQHVHAELADPAERDDVYRRRPDGARTVSSTGILRRTKTPPTGTSRYASAAPARVRRSTAWVVRPERVAGNDQKQARKPREL